MQMGINLFIQLSIPSDWKQLPSGPGENHMKRTGGVVLCLYDLYTPIYNQGRSKRDFP